MSGSRKRKNYTPAYRPEAAHLVIDTGRPIVQVAREIAVVRFCWAGGSRSSGPGQTRQRRWTSTNGPNWDGPLQPRDTTRSPPTAHLHR